MHIDISFDLVKGLTEVKNQSLKPVVFHIFIRLEFTFQGIFLILKVRYVEGEV